MNKQEQITRVIFDQNGFTTTLLEIIEETDSIVEFKDTDGSLVFTNGLSTDYLNKVELIDTENGFGLQIYSKSTSENELKSLIADYYKHDVARLKADYEESVKFMSLINDALK